MSDLKEYRIHIGNISPKLKENSNLLEQRISKFDLKMVSSLEFHTKPIETKYFAYTTVLASPSNFNKFKTSLNGVQFMGLKLSIDLAKPSYQERFHNLSKNKSKQLEQDEIKLGKIAKSRFNRLAELHTNYPTNPITSTIVTAPKPTTYSVSQHTFNNTSANTKNPPPSHRLDGSKSYGATLDNLNFKYRDGSAHSLIKGVHRSKARKDLRSQTLRILVNGELKTFKFYKTKLWGIEKNKTARDLTWRYDAKMGWKSGDDHLIEGVSRKPCGINGEQALKYGDETASHVEGSARDGDELTDEVDGDNEAQKNKAILALLLNNYDFDKPVDLEEEKNVDMDEVEIDSKGRKTVKHYDYEIEGKAGDDNDEEESGNKIDRNKAISALNSEKLVKPVKEVYYDEDDEGNELDFDTWKPTFVAEKEVGEVDTSKDHAQEQERINEGGDQNQDEDEEFIPSFGAPASNTTETLRSLFNPTTSNNQPQSQQSTFKLALSDDDNDIDESKTVQDQQKQQQEQEQLLTQIRQRKQEESSHNLQQQRQNQYGLFWPHFESPFLSTQSQLAKIGNLAESGFNLPSLSSVADGDGKEGETDYEKWFWSVRGEFTRECKRRKRDLMRIMRKKRN
ncbi:Nop8 protein [Candida orthopsilosis Co 90-125]|uniref:Nop8 protein n=1 Tax=Candida orthopsilosis (strain 90-125) TaxID=1136231 RepID=H8X8G0_CANO9|nr:Nop8 protein [Candida orthopsilosis Co 90-125]CCG24435.1 Nop8 protein [Candida orthopsilosis Co 90-125]